MPDQDIRQQVIDFWMSKGAPEHVAQGIADRVAIESGFKPTSLAMDVDNAPSGGLYQHHLSRLDSLQNAARSAGVPWTDPGFQNQFAYGEVTGGDSIATNHWQDILNAPDRGTAEALWTKYFERGQMTPRETQYIGAPSGFGSGLKSSNDGLGMSGAVPSVTDYQQIGQNALAAIGSSPSSNGANLKSALAAGGGSADDLSPWQRLQSLSLIQQLMSAGTHKFEPVSYDPFAVEKQQPMPQAPALLPAVLGSEPYVTRTGMRSRYAN